MWAYARFLLYLEETDPAELNGPESYVKRGHGAIGQSDCERMKMDEAKECCHLLAWTTQLIFCGFELILRVGRNLSTYDEYVDWGILGAGVQFRCVQCRKTVCNLVLN